MGKLPRRLLPLPYLDPRKDSMASWGCPHEIDGKCGKLNDLICDPGMKGCVLAGRYFFLSGDDKNQRLRKKQGQVEKGSDDGLSDPPVSGP